MNAGEAISQLMKFPKLRLMVQVGDGDDWHEVQRITINEPAYAAFCLHAAGQPDEPPLIERITTWGYPKEPRVGAYLEYSRGHWSELSVGTSPAEKYGIYLGNDWVAVISQRPEARE